MGTKAILPLAAKDWNRMKARAEFGPADVSASGGYVFEFAPQLARDGADQIRSAGHRGEVKMLTSCPSCLQGLKRFNDDAGLDADYIVVEIAKNILGSEWLPEYVRRANSGGIERVLV